jgi:hypothetical protein
MQTISKLFISINFLSVEYLFEEKEIMVLADRADHADYILDFVLSAQSV